jgi:hypothetical protein
MVIGYRTPEVEEPSALAVATVDLTMKLTGITPLNPEEVAKEQSDLIEFFKQEGKLVKASALERAAVAFGALTSPENAKVYDRDYFDRVAIRNTAKAVAKERGDKIDIDFVRDNVVSQSEWAQKTYREYLNGVMEEMKKAKESPAAEKATAFTNFDNEHPADKGGSKDHFKDKVAAKTEEPEAVITR